ncbi:MAG TPA: heat-inducible transcriptional repressor HrcA, partial [Aestuariivirgaceae bacterium]|nr:heat-inducible transcriptional repressor HrcA [Aestuariivirgaceae bacterium]
FARLVDTYLQTGEPVGSRTISRVLPSTLSPASVRNVMADLEEAGLIYSPHTSAGRLPTELGLRFYVDALMEVDPLAIEERARIDERVAQSNRARSVEEILTETTNVLSGLSHCAGVVVAPKINMRLRHIEFASLGPGRALVVLVNDDGTVENRAIDVPPGLPPSALSRASNFLTAHCQGKTLPEVQKFISAELTTLKRELNELTARVVEAGIATWSGSDNAGEKTLIVRGQSNLIEDRATLEDLERIRQLFDVLETKKDLVDLLGAAEKGEGVRIFIGSENKLFSLSGSSLIVAPYRDSKEKIVGVLGVIGPTRINYARIIPMVDYTARLVGRLIT